MGHIRAKIDNSLTRIQFEKGIFFLHTSIVKQVDILPTMFIISHCIKFLSNVWNTGQIIILVGILYIFKKLNSDY